MNLQAVGIGPQTALAQRVEHRRAAIVLEQRSGVLDDDGPGFGRPGHGAAKPTFRIVQHRADGLGELAGLAVYLVVAPARAGAQAGHPHRLQDLVGLARCLEPATSFMPGSLMSATNWPRPRR